MLNIYILNKLFQAHFFLNMFISVLVLLSKTFQKIAQILHECLKEPIKSSFRCKHNRRRRFQLFFSSLLCFLQQFLNQMQLLLNQISQLEAYELDMKLCCVKNNIELPRILTYPLKKVINMYKNYEKKNKIIYRDNDSAWAQNQLVLFQWIMVILSFTTETLIQKFGEDKIAFLSQTFRNKPIYIIQYEIKNMMVRGKQLRNVWTEKQEKILIECFQEAKYKNKWNEIARQLYRKSNKLYFRQGKHCRQRWVNYLFCSSQNKWSIHDDLKLFQLVNARGKKWRQISNKFNNVHSELNLKKRFKGLIQLYRAKDVQSLSQKKILSLIIQQKRSQILKNSNNQIFESLKELNQKTNKILHCIKILEEKKARKPLKLLNSVVDSEVKIQEQIYEHLNNKKNNDIASENPIKQEIKEINLPIFGTTTFQMAEQKVNKIDNAQYMEPLLQMTATNNMSMAPQYFPSQTFYPAGFVNQMGPFPFYFLPRMYYSFQ